MEKHETIGNVSYTRIIRMVSSLACFILQWNILTPCIIPNNDNYKPSIETASSFIKTVDMTLYTADKFYPYVIDTGPWVYVKPKINTRVAAKTRRKKRIIKDAKNIDDITVAAYMPGTGLLDIFKGLDSSNKLFIKAEGNEVTDCLHHNKRLWIAMQKIRKKFGKPLIIESGYRSPSYNAALRRKSKRVAKHSQHMKCAAIDFRINGISMRRLQRYVRSLPEIGGVGIYSRWVHIDTGSKRDWVG